MQNPVVLLNGYDLAFFHGIPFFFREPADLGALSQKHMPLGCTKAGPHTALIAPLLPNPPRALERVVDGPFTPAHFAESLAVRRRYYGLRAQLHDAASIAAPKRMQNEECRMKKTRTKPMRHQCDIKATSKRVASQAVATPKRRQNAECRMKKTRTKPMRHQCDIKATSKRVASQAVATHKRRQNAE